jgi:hypothetical protein
MSSKNIALNKNTVSSLLVMLDNLEEQVKYYKINNTDKNNIKEFIDSSDAILNYINLLVSTNLIEEK